MPGGRKVGETPICTEIDALGNCPDCGKLHIYYPNKHDLSKSYALFQKGCDHRGYHQQEKPNAVNEAPNQ